MRPMIASPSLAVEHREGVAGPELPGLDVAAQRLGLPGARVMHLGVDRLPRLGVRPVGRDGGGELGGVAGRQRADRGPLAVQADPRGDVAEHAANVAAGRDAARRPRCKSQAGCSGG